MRISAKIVSSGGSWRPIFPPLKNLELAFPKVGGKETYDAATGLAMLKHERITHSESDNKLVQCVAVILIDAVNRWMDEYEISGEQTQKMAPRFDRKIAQGKVSYCRVDLTSATIAYNGEIRPSVRIRISTDDNGVVESKRFERLFAWVIADIATELSKRFQKQGDMPLVLGEDIETLRREMSEFIAAEDRKEEIRKRNGERMFCSRYCHGACSPCKFDCPNFANGKCVEITEEDE